MLLVIGRPDRHHLTAWYGTNSPCISTSILHCIVLYCIVLYCIVLYCIVLYCIVLYRTAPYCIVPAHVNRSHLGTINLTLYTQTWYSIRTRTRWGVGGVGSAPIGRRWTHVRIRPSVAASMNCAWNNMQCCCRPPH